MADVAHEETDRIIEEIEKQVKKEYSEAIKEIEERIKDFLESFEEQDKVWQKRLEDGTVTQEDYNNWRVRTIAYGDRWRDMRDVLAQDLSNSFEVSKSIAEGYTPEVYAINHNFGTYEMESGGHVDTSYTLYNKETVERLFRENPQLLPNPSDKIAEDIRKGKVIQWESKKLQSALLQGILIGESIPKIAARVAAVGEMSEGASIRNARTMMTNAQSAGRMDAYKRAESLGMEVKKTWIATMDNRVRDWHRELHMVSVPLDQPFHNSIGDIMRPGDPHADGANVYNCRCTLKGKSGKVKTFSERLKEYEDAEKLDFEEWKKEHEDVSVSPEFAQFKRRIRISENRIGSKIKYIQPARLTEKLSESDIIDKVGVNDYTGSCVSLAMAYIANKYSGLDVVDHRAKYGDWASKDLFSSNNTMIAVRDSFSNVSSRSIVGPNGITAAMTLMRNIESGKEYYLSVGKHGAIVRKNTDGGWSYLELQCGAGNNGWSDSASYENFKTDVIRDRFKAMSRHSKYEYNNTAFIIDAESLGKSREFRSAVGYLNRKESWIEGESGPVTIKWR